MITTIEELIELSVKSNVTKSYEVAIDIEEDGVKHSCYEAHVSYREISLTCDECVFCYDVNNISGNDTILLNEVIE